MSANYQGIVAVTGRAHIANVKLHFWSFSGVLEIGDNVSNIISNTSGPTE